MAQQMANSYFQFKQFRVDQDHAAMKVTTDACLFGAWVASKVQGKRVLDAGAGTGLLSLMLAQRLQELTASALPTSAIENAQTPDNSFKIDAIEINEGSFLQMKINVHRSAWATQINCLLGNVNTRNGLLHEYDVIISNPPFYSNDLKSPNESKRTAHHDEMLSLTQLETIVNDLLKVNGKFYCLLPYKRMQEALSLFRVQELVTIKPTPELPASRIMFVAGSDQTEMIKSEIVIKENGKYSSHFTRLLDRFYLDI